MQFNPTDKSNSIIADIDFLLSGTSSTFNSSYSLADRTRNVNISWDETVADLFRADPNYKWDDTTNSDFPIAYLNTTAGLDHYVMLEPALVIHRVRMKDRNGHYQTLEAVDRRQISDSELTSTGTPSKYYKMSGSVCPVPIPDYSAGLGIEIEFQRGANHFTTTDTTRSPGFNSQFHQILSVSAALRFAISNGMDQKAAQLKEMRQGIRTQLQEHYQTRSPDQRPKLQLIRRSVRSYGF